MKNYIRFEEITKLFPGQAALDNVSFSVKKGEIHALLGENGAGKSTLLNILHGVFPATSGRIFIDNNCVSFANAHDAIKFGIAKVHQEINIISELTVAQNIMLGSEESKLFLLKHRDMNKRTSSLLNKLGCKFSASDKIGRLSTGEKQMTQIAKALDSNAHIVSFDEPTSSLSDNEVSQLFTIIEDLKNQGITIIYITHKMDEVFKLCDRATVLRDGKYVNTFDLSVTKETELVQSMVGRDVSMFAQRLRPSCADMDNVVLSVENLNGVKDFKNISFELHKGEILGFFGLVGAMRTEVMRGIFGADPVLSGNVSKDGKNLTKRTPASCVEEGIGLISENRKEEGFVATLNNAQNISLASIPSFEKGIFINRKALNLNAKTLGATVGLVPNRPDFMTRSLSGGNAQKVILAKWLSIDADILIFDEPTKGIDIGAKADIYKLIEDLVSKGKSIILVSSELTEVIGMSNRLLVMRGGEIVAEFLRDEFSEEKIITAAVGGYVK